MWQSVKNKPVFSLWNLVAMQLFRKDEFKNKGLAEKNHRCASFLCMWPSCPSPSIAYAHFQWNLESTCWQIVLSTYLAYSLKLAVSTEMFFPQALEFCEAVHSSSAFPSRRKPRMAKSSLFKVTLLVPILASPEEENHKGTITQVPTVAKSLWSMWVRPICRDITYASSVIGA